jgi:excisionase family DNA binding protein
MAPPKDILEPEEVAEMLRIHVRTVKILAGQGKLPGFRVGNQWRFRRSDIDKYIERQLQHPAGQGGEESEEDAA